MVAIRMVKRQCQEARVFQVTRLQKSPINASTTVYPTNRANAYGLQPVFYSFRRGPTARAVPPHYNSSKPAIVSLRPLKWKWAAHACENRNGR